MAGLAFKINQEAGENGVHSGNLAKPPTAMRAITAFGQLNQGVNLLRLNFPRGGQFLELFSHSGFTRS